PLGLSTNMNRVVRERRAPRGLLFLFILTLHTFLARPLVHSLSSTPFPFATSESTCPVSRSSHWNWRCWWLPFCINITHIEDRARVLQWHLAHRRPQRLEEC